MSSSLHFTPLPLFPSKPSSPENSVFLVRASSSFAAAPEKRPRAPRRRRGQTKDDDSSSSAAEKGLRFTFMDELMDRARRSDAVGVSDVLYDMVAAGLTPGPRSYHGLIVAHCFNGDSEAAMQSLRRELSAGLRPLHETFVALVRLFGSKGQATSGLEILAAMEKLHYDIRGAWLVLVEELVHNKYLEDANMVFLKGCKGEMRATDEIYDLMIVEDCRAGDHSNALEIAYEMEAAGRMVTTFHFNCLLSVQATCGIPEISMATFENMIYGGEDFMKPDTESYNWVIQAYTRADSYDRVQDVAELLGMMVKDYKRVQPNVKTHALLVECFTKYCVVGEAIRHFRALKNFEGGIQVLHADGNYGDPLSLYLRALCREGRIVDLLEALDVLIIENQKIPQRAMILSKKYRTLVSSWIEPLQEEAELGYEIDYVARYVAEGGLTGERKRWVPRRGKTPLDPDADGFIYSNPIETSFKQRCQENLKIYHRKLLRALRNEGISALGDATEADYVRVQERLKKLIKGPEQNVLKPKAASKMVVAELKEELEAQELPTDGTRNVLYQRVQKARRINRSRGRPLWVPPVEEEEEEVDEELDELISRIQLHEGDTEFWKRRFLGEDLKTDITSTVTIATSESGDTDAGDDTAKDAEEDDAEAEADENDEEEEEEGVNVVEEPPETPDAETVKEKRVEAKKPLQMIGVQLMKDLDQVSTSSKKSRKKSRVIEDDADEDWFPEDIYEAFKEMRKRKIFDVDDMYTIADAWGWTWEKDLKNKLPRKWSPEWEVELAIGVMLKVIELGATPTIGDCAMIMRAAIKAPLPSAFLKILQTTHALGYAFGSPLYDEIISLCIELGELDAAVAIVADLETTGITVPDETLDRVIAARQVNESSTPVNDVPASPTLD